LAGDILAVGSEGVLDNIRPTICALEGCDRALNFDAILAQSRLLVHLTGHVHAIQKAAEGKGSNQRGEA
jgi:hypothetical protein